MFRFEAIMLSFILRGAGLLAVTLALSALLLRLALVPSLEPAALSSWFPLAEPVVWAFCLGVSLLYVLSSRLFSRSLSRKGEPPAGNRLAWVLAMALGSAHLALWLFNLTDLPSPLDDAAGIAGLRLMLNLDTLLTNGITVILIVLLLCIESAILLLIRFDTLPATTTCPRPVNYKLMRPAIFLFLFGIDLSMAFLPLHMENLYQPVFGLSKDVVMGLPISVEFMFVGIAILLSGIWMDRHSWQAPFICGLILALLGSLYSWLAPDALHFIVSRALVGVGYGLVQLSAHGFVVRNTDKKRKARGLAHLMAGLYSGSICGAATGAFMAERFGYEMVFLAGALIVLAVIAYTMLFMGHAMEKRPAALVGGPAHHGMPGEVKRFLLDRRILAATLFSSLPAAIATIGFLNYFSPIYLSRMGVAESAIGQVLMLFGLCLTLLGPSIGRLVDASENKTLPILVGSLLGCAAFLLFDVLQGIAAVVAAVVLLGLSNSLVLSAQSVFVLQQDVSRQLGDGKTLGIFRATSRIGQMLGPMLFAWLIVVTDVREGMIYFGWAYLAAVVLFQLMAGREPTMAAEKVVGHE